jgi:outer membrane protein
MLSVYRNLAIRKYGFNYICFMSKSFLRILILLIPSVIHAQEKWDLRRCVDYAMKNNISVKLADVQARIANLQLEQTKLNKWPTVAFTANAGGQFGRSISPTTNLYTTNNLFFNQYQLQGGAQIYNWGRLKNTQAAAAFNAEAALADVQKSANDIALNVASYYLQVLAANEQIEVSKIQIGQTKAQYDITKKKVDAGALPELNLVELESQLATDSSNLVTAQATFDQDVLLLKALLNIDMAAPFDVDTPPVETIPLEPLSELQPEYVFKLAMASWPEQKAYELRVKGAEKNIKVQKASMYPSLTGFYGLGTTYNNVAQIQIDSFNYVNPNPVGTVKVGGTDYNVYNYNPFTIPVFGKQKYFDQINHNFSQNIGVGLSIPIFNNGSYRTAYKRSKLDLETLQLQAEQAKQTLQSNIYTAYSNAISSMEKYNASTKAVESAQKAYDFALKRYDVGLLSTIDLLTNQNNLLTAKLQQLANHYDYVFKMKVLEFYKGQGVKL